MDLNTYIYNERDQRIGSLPGMVPLPVDSVIILPRGRYIVKEVELYLDNKDPEDFEDLGIRLYCEPVLQGN